MLRRNSAKTDYPIASREEADQIALHLDRLAAIEAAVPEEAADLQRAHDKSGLRKHSASEWAAMHPMLLIAITEATDERCAALLAIVGKQQEQIQALAEGVRLLIKKHDGTATSMQEAREWEAKHGHLVEKKVTT